VSPSDPKAIPKISRMEDSPVVSRKISEENPLPTSLNRTHSPKLRWDLDPPQILDFLCESNKKVINMMIRGKPELIDEALGRVVLGRGNVLEFDVKKIYFKKEVGKIKEKLRDRHMPISFNKIISFVIMWV
jgi:hypothetical protein